MAVLLKNCVRAIEQGNGKVLDDWRVRYDQPESERFEDYMSLQEKIKSQCVDTENVVDFYFDDDLNFHYIDASGTQKKGELTWWAFTQIAGRCGVPVDYINKCLASRRKDLAVVNLNEWAESVDKEMVIRRYINPTNQLDIVRGCVSDRFQRELSTSTVLDTLNNKIDFSDYKIRASQLDIERCSLRLTRPQELKVGREGFVDVGDKLFGGFIISDSEVGKSSCSLSVFVWRLACRNGLILPINSMIYKKRHYGGMVRSFDTLNEIVSNIDTNFEGVEEMLCKTIENKLSDEDAKLWLLGFERDFDLSKKKVERLQGVVSSYSQMPNRWRIINAVTDFAHGEDLDTRTRMESYASRLLVGA